MRTNTIGPVLLYKPCPAPPQATTHAPHTLMLVHVRRGGRDREDDLPQVSDGMFSVPALGHHYVMARPERRTHLEIHVPHHWRDEYVNGITQFARAHAAPSCTLSKIIFVLISSSKK